ncbi:MAG: TlpA family protein disulfide reductase [Actinomycetales bacterium]
MAAGVLLLALLGGALISVTGCSTADAQGDAVTADSAGFVAGDGSITVLDPQQRQPAPQISGPLLGGGSLDLSQFAGQVIVLNVWASWCAPCRAEAPVLERLWQEQAGQGVQFVGLDTRDSTAAALAFVDRFGITYPNIVDEAGLLQLQFRQTLPPQAIPSTVVIDAQGRVAARLLGKVSEASLRAVIDEVR